MARKRNERLNINGRDPGDRPKTISRHCRCHAPRFLFSFAPPFKFFFSSLIPFPFLSPNLRKFFYEKFLSRTPGSFVQLTRFVSRESRRNLERKLRFLETTKQLVAENSEFNINSLHEVFLQLVGKICFFVRRESTYNFISFKTTKGKM